MMRGYFSLALPVGLTAIAAITWMQFRDAIPALAGDGGVLVAQAQPQIDPFAPQPEAAQPNPQPANPQPGQPMRPGKQRPQVEVPKSKDEVKTPLLRSLLDTIDEIQEGTDEEKDGLRQMLYEADVELRHSLGSDMRKTIRDFNNPRHKPFEVKPQASRYPPKSRVKPKTTPAPRPMPPAAENPSPAPPANPEPTPAPNPIDDLFKDPSAENSGE